MATVLNRLSSRIRRNGWIRTFTYALFVVVLERCGVSVTSEFKLGVSPLAPSNPPPDGFMPAFLTKMSQLTDRDRDFLRDYGEEEGFGLRFSKGKTCLVLRSLNGDLACACWFGPVPNGSAHIDSRDGMIDHCFTHSEYRGQGLYPWALRHIGALTDETNEAVFSSVFIECSRFNHASASGIRKAGFTPTRTYVTFGNRTLLAWQSRDTMPYEQHVAIRTCCPPPQTESCV
jgi:hypothetical protein